MIDGLHGKVAATASCSTTLSEVIDRGFNDADQNQMAAERAAAGTCHVFTANNVRATSHSLVPSCTPSLLSSTSSSLPPAP